MRLALIVAAVIGAVPFLDPRLSGRAIAADPAPFGHQGEWTLLFEDDFSGGKLDDSKWVSCYWWDAAGCTNLGNAELQWYLPDNVSVRDGTLLLSARPELTARPGAVYGYSSGIVTTGRLTYDRTPPTKFEFQYGYVEVRARVPAGKGLWPAVWLLPARQAPLPEIDVMEVLGHEPDVLHLNFHYRDGIGRKRNVGTSVAVPDLSIDWHVYAVDWSPERIIWYFDGVEQWRYEVAPHVPHEPMYLLVNLAVGGIWAGAPDEDTAFPADYAVDYVRIWQHAE